VAPEGKYQHLRLESLVGERWAMVYSSVDRTVFILPSLSMALGVPFLVTGFVEADVCFDKDDEETFREDVEACFVDKVRALDEDDFEGDFEGFETISWRNVL
jgi:hypothetical protein